MDETKPIRVQVTLRKPHGKTVVIYQDAIKITNGFCESILFEHPVEVGPIDRLSFKVLPNG